MNNPNEFSKVKLISNPVKSIVLHHDFSDTDTKARCKLDPQFIDIREGVWQVAVSHVLILNKAATELNTVFDLKTNLSYTCQIIDHQSVTVNECLASVKTQCKQDEFVFYTPPARVFYTVNDASTDSFILTLTRSKILTRENQEHSVKVEVLLLFQRMM